MEGESMISNREERRNSTYRAQILDNNISSHEIMKTITTPQRVFKYRKFVEPGNPDKMTFWKESLDGVMYFSLPNAFNSNDSDDCIFLFDKKKCKEKILELSGISKNKIGMFKTDVVMNAIWNSFEQLIENNVRNNVKIGCFTIRGPEHDYMWKSLEFGAEHKGYCIEYEVDQSVFYPDPIVFMPVLYDEVHVDMTDVIIDLIEARWNGEEIETRKTLMSNGYNFCLCKLLKYKDEFEWRMVITKNRWEEYFDINQENKRDFSKNMKAIYLGADCKQLKHYEEYRDYAINVCKEKNIPLYQMEKEMERLIKIQLY